MLYCFDCRDTQSAIKAENSMVTFGEISKIVASMWDSLSEEAKQVRVSICLKIIDVLVRNIS